MSSLASQLLTWFDLHGRTNLPWQATYSSPLGGQATYSTGDLQQSSRRSPLGGQIGQKAQPNVYHVWLSEVMLQQTQVDTVIDYFNRFIHHFPTLKSLADASEDAVLAQWAGLGYYARARNLHKTAKIIMHDYQGNFPQIFEQVLALPGIGKSTAGAILALGFNQRQAILDGNVKRVLSRVHQLKGHYAQSSVLKELWRLAEYHTPEVRVDHYTQAIMDLGATLCTRAQPKCSHCPIRTICGSYKNQTQARYPEAKPKKLKPSRSIAMLIFMNDNKIHLQKRPDKGIWGGLWSFVECEDSAQSIEKSIRRFDPLAEIVKHLPIFKHTFTHYHLHIHPIIVNCYSTQAEFYPPDNLKFGVPKPVETLIAQMTRSADN